MRKLNLIDSLFPKVRQRILGTLLLAPDHEWYLSDLASHFRTSPSSLHRELVALTLAGILLGRKDGNRTYYRANVECPVYEELRGLLLKTAGLVDEVRDALLPHLAQIQLAFIYGSMASGSERSTSDVDLLIVGPITLQALSHSMKVAEERLGREVNPSLYSAAEFRDRLRTKNHLLDSVLKGTKLFVVGTENDLAAIRTGGQGEASHNEQARAR